MDAITRSSLLIQKMVSNAPVVNIYKQWNIVCTKIPFPKIETKELPAHDFSGSNGEDTYIPSFMPFKPYDLQVEFAYKGTEDECYNDVFKGFLKYLQGTEPASDNYDEITEGGFKIYDQHNLVGRQKVYLKIFDPNELIHQSGDHLTFKFTFSVTDPDTDITLIDPKTAVSL